MIPYWRMNFTEFEISKTDIANTITTVLKCSRSSHSRSVPTARAIYELNG